MIVVPLYKGKRNDSEYRNYRGISLLSVMEKVYEIIIINRVKVITGGLIENEKEGRRENFSVVVDL